MKKKGINGLQGEKYITIYSILYYIDLMGLVGLVDLVGLVGLLH